MKKFVFALLLCLIVTYAYAAQRVTIVNGQGEEVSNTSNQLKVLGDVTHLTIATGTVVAGDTLDDSPTATYSTTLTNAGYERIMFFVHYDETDPGTDTTVTLTIDSSFDNSNWREDIGFYSATAPSTVITSLLSCTGASDDDNEAVIIDAKESAPYYRVQFTGTGTAAGGTDQVVVNAYYAVLE